ncbi:unnamed protein product [Dicrocoelium dendriticum]|nr:unnamed protein product [Dicrocoelium dendriticum]
MALAHSVSELTISSEVNPPPRTACSRDSEKLTSDPKLGTISPSLLRLFKSSVFTMDLALQYMFKEENPFVKVYLAHRLYGFDPVDVDFYLPQLVSLYQHSSELAEGLHPYFISRYH